MLKLSLKPPLLNSKYWRDLSDLASLFPLTIRGTTTLLVCAAALWWFGYGRLDLVVFALAICALTILVFCLFCTVIGGLLIQRRIAAYLKNAASQPGAPTPTHSTDAGNSRHGTLHLEAEFPNESGFHTPAMRFFPLLKLHWQLVRPDAMFTRIRANSSNQLVEELIPQRRCKTPRMIRQFTVADVLGFCRFSWQMHDNTPCLALPRTNTLKHLPLLRSMTAEDGIPSQSGTPQGDRMEIRPYVPGDSVRDILWKSYARNRQLNVRLAEKSVFHSDRTLAYLLSSPNDEAAAAVTRVALESGTLGDDWIFGADGTEQPCQSLPEALEAVAASRAIDTPHRYGLDEFLAIASTRPATHCLIFAAADGDNWLTSLKHTIGHNSAHFSLILATDGFQDTTPVSFWRHLLFRKSLQKSLQKPSHEQQTNSNLSETAASRQTMLALLAELGPITKSTLVVDRQTGLCFDHGLHRV
ncbi:MAG: DUF58 domain-containing protein [Pseudohongiellaceae bacterium]